MEEASPSFRRCEVKDKGYTQKIRREFFMGGRKIVGAISFLLHHRVMRYVPGQSHIWLACWVGNSCIVQYTRDIYRLRLLSSVLIDRWQVRFPLYYLFKDLYIKL